MTITNQPQYTKPVGQKNIFLHRETILILLVILGSIGVLTLLFFTLWSYFKIGFVCVLAFILIVVTRRTDAWKMGIECYYIFTFLLAYAFSPILALCVTIPAVLFVIKFFRPDEFAGSLTQITGMVGMALTAQQIAIRIGPEITQSQLLLAGVVTFLFWDFIRFLVALKIAPTHWVKLFASLITGVFVNYFYYLTFAYALLQFLFTI